MGGKASLPNRARRLHPRRMRVLRGITMASSVTEAIRDRAGNIVGHIERQADGNEILRDTDDRVRGYYDAEGDYTRDADQKIVAKGNKLRSMVC